MSTPTETELEQLAVDVSYELTMLAGIAMHPDPMPLPGYSLHPQALGFALLESTLLHLRNIDEFLRAGEAPVDDVIARHYLDTWNPAPVLTDDERADLNKRQNHLSRQRVRVHAVWDRKALALRALSRFKDFHSALAAVHPDRAAWFAGAIAHADTLVGASSAGSSYASTTGPTGPTGPTPSAPATWANITGPTAPIEGSMTTATNYRPTSTIFWPPSQADTP